MAFSPDSRILASEEGDAISLWEVASGQEISLFRNWKDSFWARLSEEKIAPLRVPRTIVRSIAFSPDGTKLASAHSDTTAIVWDLTPWRTQMARHAAERQVELEAAWKALAGNDASRAYEAIFQFALVPERAVPFLAQHVRPVAPLSPEDRKHHAQLIANLDSPHFHAREQA